MSNSITIILLILLTLSIINNFLMYKYGYRNECPTSYVKTSGLPSNIKFKTFTFFYKDKPFNKCLKEDYLLEKIPDRYDGEVQLKSILNKLNNNKVTWIKNDENINELYIDEVNYSNILKLY